MSTAVTDPPPVPRLAPPKRVNLRTPEVMAAVQAQVENHYRSGLVEQVRARGGVISAGGLTVRLAKQFGFCYGVERAIDLAYAARKVFADRRVFILGEIIHNPEVNEQIRSMGIRNLIGPNREAELDDLTAEDVVLVPAFGAEVSTIETIQAKGCQIVDTTCGDVMSVWKRVRQYAAEQATSIIHGKAQHEETKATASRALGKSGTGHYLVVLTLEEVDYVGDYIRRGGDRDSFLTKFAGAHSPRFRPGTPPEGRRRRQPDDHAARGNRGGSTPRPPGHRGPGRPGDGCEQFPVLRHHLRRHPRAAGRPARPLGATDGPDARRRRLQLVQHVPPGRDGPGQTADVLHP